MLRLLRTHAATLRVHGQHLSTKHNVLLSAKFATLSDCLRTSKIIPSFHDDVGAAPNDRASLYHVATLHKHAKCISMDGDAILARGPTLSGSWEKELLDRVLEKLPRDELVLMIGLRLSAQGTVAGSPSFSVDNLSARLHGVLDHLGPKVHHADVLLMHADGAIPSPELAAPAATKVARVVESMLSTRRLRHVAVESDDTSGIALAALLEAQCPGLVAVAYAANLGKFPVPGIAGGDWPIARLARQAGLLQLAKSPLDILVRPGLPFRCVGAREDRAVGGIGMGAVGQGQDGEASSGLTAAASSFNTALSACINLELAWDKVVMAAALKEEATYMQGRSISMIGEQRIESGQDFQVASLPPRAVTWGRTLAGNIPSFLGPHGSILLWMYTKQRCIAPAVQAVVLAVLRSQDKPRDDSKGDTVGAVIGGPACDLGARPGNTGGGGSGRGDVADLTPKQWAMAYRVAMVEACTALDVLVETQHAAVASGIAAKLSVSIPELEVESIGGGVHVKAEKVSGCTDLAGRALRVLLCPSTGLDGVLSECPEALYARPHGQGGVVAASPNVLAKALKEVVHGHIAKGGHGQANGKGDSILDLQVLNDSHVQLARAGDAGFGRRLLQVQSDVRAWLSSPV